MIWVSVNYPQKKTILHAKRQKKIDNTFQIKQLSPPVPQSYNQGQERMFHMFYEIFKLQRNLNTNLLFVYLSGAQHLNFSVSIYGSQCTWL